MTGPLWLAVVLTTLPLQLEAEQSPTRSAKPELQTCDAMSRQLFGVPPTRVAGPVREPKLLHHEKPAYPDVPAGTIGSGIWVGEALIGPDGLVRNVSVLRDLKFTPPFPQFSRAISDSILKWRYAPTAVDGKAVPVCMTVTVNIHWR